MGSSSCSAACPVCTAGRGSSSSGPVSTTSYLRARVSVRPCPPPPLRTSGLQRGVGHLLGGWGRRLRLAGRRWCVTSLEAARGSEDLAAQALLLGLTRLLDALLLARALLCGALLSHLAGEAVELRRRAASAGGVACAACVRACVRACLSACACVRECACARAAPRFRRRMRPGCAPRRDPAACAGADAPWPSARWPRLAAAAAVAVVGAR
jgi:hypothetical protein